MARERFVVKRRAGLREEQFDTAEEAWLWYAQCQVARNEGARNIAGYSDVSRPCDPDDIYRAVQVLYQKRRIRIPHVKVLFRFGLSLMCPNGNVRGEEQASRLWEEALDLLTTPLKQKGIVA